MRSTARGTTHHQAWHRRRVDIRDLAARWLGLLAGTVAAFVLIFAAAERAAADSCVAPSYKAVRGVFGCEYIRLLRVQRNGGTPDFSRCETQLARKMSRADGRYDACPSTNDLIADVDACVAAAQVLVDPGTNHVCRIRYYGQARAFSRCGLGAIIKSLRTGDAADFSRCNQRLARVLGRTKARLDGCPTVEDAVFEGALLDCLADLASTIENAPTPTATATATETEVPIDTPTPTATLAATDTPTPGPTDTPTEVPTDTPVPTATATEAATDTPAPTATATEIPTDTPVPPPTETPTEVPTDTPAPTETPTEIPTDTPTPLPTFTPTSTPTEVPTVPTAFRRVFITSTTTNGSFPNGGDGADAFCQARADAAGLPGRFVAWVSEGTVSTQARDRQENAAGPYRHVNGTKVADDFNDIVDGTLDAPINLDENGTVRTGSGNVWTGTDDNGTGVFGSNNNTRCGGWESSSSGDGGRVGSSSVSNSDWTNSGTNDNCNVANRLYCFQSNHRTVFVTSTTHNGNFGGVRGADAFCQARADAAGLDANFVAWLSSGDTETQARDRIENAPAPYRLVNGVKVADNWNDLTDGSLDNPIDVDENGTPRSITNGVWTGTDDNGTGVVGGDASTRCAQWTSSSSSDGGRVASSNAVNGDWTNTGDNEGCNTANRVYCVESQLKCGVGSKCFFRTDKTHSADFGGLSGADAGCQAAADASSGVAIGTYKAWLSTESVSASARLTHASIPYVLPNGDIVANGWADLTDGDLDNIPCVDQHGINRSATPCFFLSTWTATDAAGNFSGPGSCNEWSAPLPLDESARYGNEAATSSAWTDAGSATCDSIATLYCLQQ